MSSKKLFLKEAEDTRCFRSARGYGRACIRKTASRFPTRIGASTRQRRFAYFDRAPFPFNGKVEKVDVTLQ